MSQDHPIMITLRDTISGDGFLAGITLSGRALMRKEEGKWWMYGVRPAALAESGETIEEAFARFRNRYKEVLFDLAEENATFDSFKVAVEQFFYETDADSEDERLWEEALKAIRAFKM
jgi:predicted RNase H-like HicB family nuclease